MIFVLISQWKGMTDEIIISKSKTELHGYNLASVGQGY